MRHLIVMRHAKSDWEAGADDHARPLNDRGRRAAADVGRFMHEAGLVPEVAFTSTAVRARTTLELASSAGSWDTRIEAFEALYSSTVDDALEVACGAGAIDSLMLVGHEPTWTALVQRLTGAAVDMRTATVVGIDVDLTDWADLGGARCAITYVVQPRHLEGR